MTRTWKLGSVVGNHVFFKMFRKWFKYFIFLKVANLPCLIWKYYRSKSCHNWSDSHGISKTYTFSDLYCFFLRFFSWFWIMNFSLNVQWVNNTNTYSDMKIVLPQNVFELIVWGTSFPVQREKDMVDFRRNGARFSKKMLDTLQKHNNGTVQCWGLLNIAIFLSSPLSIMVQPKNYTLHDRKLS